MKLAFILKYGIESLYVDFFMKIISVKTIGPICIPQSSASNPLSKIKPSADFHEILHRVLHKKLSSRREFHETLRSDCRTLLTAVNQSERTLPTFLQLFG
jgi:hypothetical protein